MTVDERKQRLYDATHQGADIIRMSHSGAAAVIGTNRKFKLRDERNASACVEAPKGNRTYWRVADYGDRNFNPIDFYIHTSGLDPERDFMLALEQLEREFNCGDTLSKQDNRYDFLQHSPTDEQRRQGYGFDIMDGFTTKGLECWGQGVIAEVLGQLGWQQLKGYWWYSKEKDLVYEVRASDSFVVFVQRCEYYDQQHRCHSEFFKLYQPQHYDKQWRFRYFGQVQAGYVFCLDAVKQALESMKSVTAGNGEEGSQEQKTKKLTRILVVSGCSDCVNAWAMGFPAVYGMSEVGGISKETFTELSKLAWQVVCIPDIDETGTREGKQQALRLPDLYTAWPTEEDMGFLLDNRGNKKKDLKDYRSLHPKREDFQRLVNRALKARFYETLYDKNGKICGYKLSNENIVYFLWLHGYSTLRQDSQKDPAYVHIDNNHVVRSLSAEAVRNELMEICRQEAFPKEVLNMLYSSAALPTDKKSMLQRVGGLDFSKATEREQLFFFRNHCFVEVTADAIRLRRMTELSNRHVWSDSIIQHDVRLLPAMFKVDTTDDGNPVVTITQEGQKCKLLTLLCNTSRLYWRKEDERHEALTDEEKAEQTQCLLAKLVNMGYLFYSQKLLSEAYLTVFMDYKVGATTREANGGTGKSTLLKFIEAVSSHHTIRTYNPKLFESNFFFAGVSESHDLLILDDCVEDLPWAYLNNAVTDGLTVEAKHQNPYTIPFVKSPKMVAATNWVVKDESPSIQRRQWPITFSDYYHHRTRQNDYLEERHVSDTFGQDLFGPEYAEDDWVRDLNLMMQCVQFYLSLPKGQRKVMPPMRVIEQRIDQALMGVRFVEVADSLLDVGSELLDKNVSQASMMAAFAKQKYEASSKTTFTQKLKAYCHSKGYVLNPARVTHKPKDGCSWQVKENGVLVNYYYIQSSEPAAPVDLTIFQGDDAPPF